MIDNNDIDTRLWDHYLTSVNNYEEFLEESSVTEIDKDTKDIELTNYSVFREPR